ncbi:MAG: DinB family protein [Fimbriimonadaceae bacterium]|nr:DinB family protein [Fimbriimonadaceae bacterium]
MAHSIDFQQATTTLLRECFEGVPQSQDYSWFIQRNEALFDSFDSVTAEQASTHPAPDCSTIAAHTYHILFAMRWANNLQGGPEPVGTWETSWDKQSVNEAEWKELVATVRSECNSFVAWFEKNEDWSDEDNLIGALNVLPHMAYHLGAIRQLMKFV